jgi:hypothetical protein
MVLQQVLDDCAWEAPDAIQVEEVAANAGFISS